MEKQVDNNHSLFLFLAFYSLIIISMSFIYTWDMPIKISSSVYGDSHPDVFNSILMLHKLAFDQSKTSPFFPLNPSIHPLNDYLGMLLTKLFSSVAAYNILILWTFPLSALGMYYFAFSLTKDKLASAIAGLAYAFSPYHMIRSHGHIDLAQIQWLPFYFNALFMLYEKPSLRRSFLALLFYVVVLISSFYYGYMVLILTFIFLAALLVKYHRNPKVSISIVLVTISISILFLSLSHGV